jgi:hypothetical protein
MNALVILLFSALSWEMTYVWIILPVTLLLPNLIPVARFWFITVTGIAVALLNISILAMPVLDSLNIIGGVILTGCLGILLWESHLALCIAPEKLRGTRDLSPKLVQT